MGDSFVGERTLSELAGPIARLREEAKALADRLSGAEHPPAVAKAAINYNIKCINLSAAAENVQEAINKMRKAANKASEARRAADSSF